MVKNICILALALVFLVQAGQETITIKIGSSTTKVDNDTHSASNGTSAQNKTVTVAPQPVYRNIVQISQYSSIIPIRIIPVIAQNASSKATSNTTVNKTLYQLKQVHANWTSRHNSSKQSNTTKTNATVTTTVQTGSTSANTTGTTTSNNTSGSATSTIKTVSTVKNSTTKANKTESRPVPSPNSIFLQNPFNIRFIPPVSLANKTANQTANHTANRTRTNHTWANFTHSNTSSNKTSVPVNFTIVITTPTPLNIAEPTTVTSGAATAASGASTASSSSGSSSSSSSGTSSSTASSTSGITSSSGSSSTSSGNSSTKGPASSPATNQNFKYTLTPLKCTCDGDCENSFSLAKLFLIKVACDTKNSICIRTN